MANRNGTRNGVARILVVDDEAPISEVIRLVLEAEDLGCVWLAQDCDGAIDIARREQPNIAVLDYMMPNTNGEAIAARLREIVPDIKIVSFSAALDAAPPWADEFVNKVEIADLPAAVRRLIPAA